MTELARLIHGKIIGKQFQRIGINMIEVRLWHFGLIRDYELHFELLNRGGLYLVSRRSWLFFYHIFQILPTARN